MALAFDAARGPMRADEFVDLVRAVVGAANGDESHWIEWKGTLNLRAAEGKAAVVRTIAGLANRIPETAARFCEGRGYVVIGAEPGQVAGVAEEDPADLSQWWTPYLGVDGPRWIPHWVAFNGKTVLVVEVAAPRRGDPVFTIRKEMSGAVRDGDVFVRRIGKTERATSAELAALVERSAGATVLAGVTVTLARPDAIRPVRFGAQEREAWIDAARDGALESLRQAQQPPDPKPVKATRRSFSTEGAGPSIADLERLEERQAQGDELTADELAQLGHAKKQVGQLRDAFEGLAKTSFIKIVPEDRTAEEYEAEVSGYVDELDETLLDELRAVASQLLEPCVIELRNETAANLPEVRLVLHVPGQDTFASEPDEDGPGLPEPPRPFGPRQVSLLGGLGLGHSFPYVLPPGSYAVSRGPGVQIDNGGSATLRFDPIHLRPHDTVQLPPVVLALPPGDAVAATWEATSTGTDGVLRGTLLLPVDGTPLAVEEALRSADAD